jgi:hypothetical protein
MLGDLNSAAPDAVASDCNEGVGLPQAASHDHAKLTCCSYGMMEKVQVGSMKGICKGVGGKAHSEGHKGCSIRTERHAEDAAGFCRIRAGQWELVCHTWARGTRVMMDVSCSGNPATGILHMVRAVLWSHLLLLWDNGASPGGSNEGNMP